MRLSRFLLILFVLSLFTLTPSCASKEKATTRSRNLMMPAKEDLKRNSKYKAPKKKKTYKPKKIKKKK